MAEVISRRLGALLAAGREEYNARFEAARYRHGALDGAAFLASFAALAGPFFTDESGPSREADAALCAALYDAALALTGTRHLGPGGRSTELSSRLPELLVPWRRALAEDPAGTIARAANALLNLSAPDASRAHAWLAVMKRLCADDPPASAFVERGLAAAWVSGMASARDEALTMCRSMTPEILMLLFGLDSPRPPTENDGRRLIDGLERDPWLSPHQVLTENPGLQRPALYRRTGGHTAFGGPFESVPQVMRDGEMIIVREGVRHHRLWADWFGTAIVPLAQAPREARADKSTGGLATHGIVSPGGVTIPQGKLAIASAAQTSTTVCVATHHSYCLFIFGLPGSAA